MDKNFFEGVQINEFNLSTGAKVGLPVRYYEWSSIMADFPAPTEKVRNLLPSRKLKPVQIRPGTAVVCLAAMEYRCIADVAPYNEFGIMVPVLYEPTVNILGLPLIFPNRFSKFGLYVHHLPVTTQEAYVFGVEIWGYPKFVAEITFEDKAEVRHCHLKAEGQDILILEVKKLETKPRFMDLYSYTVKDNELLRTLIQIRGDYGRIRFGGGASFKLGNHPVAKELRSLNMSESPIESLYATGLQSMIHPAGQKFPIS